jgi:hypothetical protein
MPGLIGTMFRAATITEKLVDVFQIAGLRLFDPTVLPFLLGRVSL